MTAEFAVALPAVALVLGLCVGAVQAAGLGVRLQDAAADAARGLARGDDPALVESRATGAGTGIALSTWHDGEAVCAELIGTVALAGAIPVTLRAESCAIDGGR